MATTVGKINYELSVNNKKFVSGMKQASSSAGSLQSRMMNSKGFQNFTMWANRAALAAGALALVMIKKGMDAFELQIEAEHQLAIVMRGRLKATDASVKSFKAYASQLQKTGVIGDEIILKGAAQLASFADSEEALKSLTAMVADFVVGTAKGSKIGFGDMTNAALLWGKALAGETGTLSRYGIILTDAQREIFNTGTQMERLEAISALMNEKGWIGANYAMANTELGKLRQAQNEMGDQSEELGESFIGIWTGIQQMIINVTNAFGGLTNTVAGLIATFATIKLLSVGVMTKLIITGLAKLWAINPFLALTVGTIGLGAMFGGSYLIAKSVLGSDAGKEVGSAAPTPAPAPATNVATRSTTNNNYQSVNITMEADTVGRVNAANTRKANRATWN